jgi:uncharacterized protein YecT (DUF1311 family)
MSRSNSARWRRYLAAGLTSIGVFFAMAVSQSRAADPNDVKILQDCSSENSELDCIGKIFALCDSKPDKPQDPSACFAREYQAWDGVLDGIYERLATQVDPASKPKIAVIKAAWAAVRQQTCAFFAAAHKDDLAAMRLNICLEEETANRVYVIKSMTSMF